jgi:hypothetical protein
MSTNSKEYMREYQRRNKERIKKQRQEYYETNKDDINRKSLDRYAENREDQMQKMREYNNTHKEERKVRDIARKDEIRKTENEYRKNRYQNDPSFRILISCRTRIRKALEGIGDKSAPTQELIGCSTDDLKAHLESQFVEGMSWDNYGEWHIDHIKPCASFDLTDPEEQKTCFHFENMQPLWAFDNLIKGDRYEESM